VCVPCGPATRFDVKGDLVIDLRPDEIVRWRFSRRLYGVSPRQVRRFLHQVARALDCSRNDVVNEVIKQQAIRQRLQETLARIEELQKQVVTVREQLEVERAHAVRLTGARPMGDKGAERPAEVILHHAAEKT